MDLLEIIFTASGRVVKPKAISFFFGNTDEAKKTMPLEYYLNFQTFIMFLNLRRNKRNSRCTTLIGQNYDLQHEIENFHICTRNHLMRLKETENLSNLPISFMRKWTSKPHKQQTNKNQKTTAINLQ